MFVALYVCVFFFIINIISKYLQFHSLISLFFFLLFFFKMSIKFWIISSNESKKKWNEKNPTDFHNFLRLYFFQLLSIVIFFKYISPNLQPKFLVITRIHPTFHFLINIFILLKKTPFACSQNLNIPLSTAHQLVIP